MKDIDNENVIRQLKEYPGKVVFGWESMEKLNEFILDRQALERLGFRTVAYKAAPIFRTECGQVVFRRSYDQR